MIQITPHMKILVAIEAVDGRKGIDSLARLCEEKLGTERRAQRDGPSCVSGFNAVEKATAIWQK